MKLVKGTWLLYDENRLLKGEKNPSRLSLQGRYKSSFLLLIWSIVCSDTESFQMYSEVKGRWISQIRIAFFLSNTEEGSVSNKSSYTGQLCLASAVLRAFSATCFSWAQQSLQEQLRFRGAFSLEMSGFHGLNRKGVGNPVEVRHSSNTLCGSESYSSTRITWAAVWCVCG